MVNKIEIGAYAIFVIMFLSGVFTHLYVKLNVIQKVLATGAIAFGFVGFILTIMSYRG